MSRFIDEIQKTGDQVLPLHLIFTVVRNLVAEFVCVKMIDSIPKIRLRMRAC